MNCGTEFLIFTFGMVIIPLITLGLLKITQNEEAQEIVMFFFLLCFIGTPFFLAVHSQEQEYTKITQDGKVYLGDFLDKKLRNNVKIVDINKTSFGENSDFNKGLSRITLYFSDGDKISINENEAIQFRNKLGKFKITSIN